MRKMKVNRKIKRGLKSEFFEVFVTTKKWISHYRELVTSWRNETTDLLKNSLLTKSAIYKLKMQ